MKKPVVIVAVLMILLLGVLLSPWRLAVLDILFPTCTETWFSMYPDPEWTECSCKGVTVSVLPRGYMDYVKEVCIGIPHYE